MSQGGAISLESDEGRIFDLDLQRWDEDFEPFKKLQACGFERGGEEEVIWGREGGSGEEGEGQRGYYVAQLLGTDGDRVKIGLSHFDSMNLHVGECLCQRLDDPTTETRAP